MSSASERAAGPIGKGDVPEHLNGLTAFVKGDLTKLSTSKAEITIRHWEHFLVKAGPAVKAIHTELGELCIAVTAQKPDGAAIAELLTSLGTKTAKVADGQRGVVGTALRSFASALTNAGESLADT